MPLRAPGLGWLPAVWRRGATLQTVLRFVLLGPLIGGAPYVIFIFPIPFAYAFGALPALVLALLQRPAQARIPRSREQAAPRRPLPPSPAIPSPPRPV